MGPFIDLEAKRRIEALEANPPPADAAALDYTPTTAGDWPDPDPATVGGALDGLAGRVMGLEDADSPPADASELGYAPTVGGDWPDPDPGDVGEALDDLAGRVRTLEVGPLALAVALGAELGDVIRATVTCTDGGGAAVAAARVLVELLTGALTPADMASQAFDLVTGTAQSSDSPGSNTAMLVEADAATIAVDVTDKTAALAGDVWLRLTPVDRAGPVVLHKLTFA